jgi:alcohol dehydrogenase class IV
MIEGSPIIPQLFFNQSVHYRKGAITLLKNLPTENILVVAYPDAKENDAYNKAIENLEGKTVFQEICDAATNGEVSRIRSKYVDNRPDLIIAFGGGQVLDTAKMVRLLLENPDRDFSNILDEGLADRSIPYIAVPTTPSTGSEANGTAVIRDEQAIKIPYLHRKLIPDVAILDASFLATLAQKQVFTFLGDVFGHANESMVSKKSNPMVIAISWGIIDLLKQVASGLREKPGDVKALEKLQQAGYLGGLVTGSVYVGVCHALAHTLEQQKGVPHSTGVLTLTPRCLAWHSKVTEDPLYDRLLKDFDIIGLNEYVVPDVLRDIDTDLWAKQAMEDPSIKTSPVRMKEDNLAELIQWILKP